MKSKPRQCLMTERQIIRMTLEKIIHPINNNIIIYWQSQMSMTSFPESSSSMTFDWQIFRFIIHSGKGIIKDSVWDAICHQHKNLQMTKSWCWWISGNLWRWNFAPDWWFHFLLESLEIDFLRRFIAKI